MHGLTNRAIECFIMDTYGRLTWTDVATRAGLDFDTFEALLRYDDGVTERVIAAAVERLGKPRDVFLEDLGTYLVSHPTTEALRRLLRFGGVSFADFLGSLEDLPGRARLAVPDLDLPELEVVESGDSVVTLRCRAQPEGFGWVLVGVLRAMADDYGALVLLDHLGTRDGVEMISVQVHAASFAEGRSFALA